MAKDRQIGTRSLMKPFFILKGLHKEPKKQTV